MARKSYTARQIERSQTLICGLRHIYSVVKAFGMSHDESVRATNTYMSDAGYAKLNAYYRGYVDGVRAEMFNTMFLYDLEWRLMCNGKLVKDDEIPADQRQYVEGGCYVWKHKPDKVFY